MVAYGLLKSFIRMLNMRYLQLLALTLSVAATNVYADAKEFYYQRHLQKHSKALATTIHEFQFDQLVDPSDSQKGTFKQRYYIDETYGQAADSPVFFYICGEATCHASALNGAIREHAKRFHAKLIALEHRFYGKSQPFTKLTTENLAYLSTGNALKDLARFQRAMMETKAWSGKWVAFGGSYPGSLSAFYRLNYPELVVGALASSAPVKAKANFEEYDAHVTKVVGDQCATKMREVVSEIEAARNNKKAMLAIKKSFDAEDITDDVDFLYAIADVGATAAQYGMKDLFCQALDSEKGAMAGYVSFAQYLAQSWQMRMIDMTAQAAMSEEPLDYLNTFGMRQWLYQSCTEYGYWQNAHHDKSLSTRSSAITLEYHQQLCQRLFGIDYPVDTQATNTKFYLPLFDASVSDIYFTNGEQDPWSNLSLTANNGNASNPLLTYYTIKDAAHCDDLRSSKLSDNESLKLARKQLDNLIDQWLN